MPLVSFAEQGLLGLAPWAVRTGAVFATCTPLKNKRFGAFAALISFESGISTLSIAADTSSQLHSAALAQMHPPLHASHFSLR